MAEKRDPQQVKEIGIARMKKVYEQQNRTTCSSEQVRKFEKLYQDKILPQVYKQK